MKYKYCPDCGSKMTHSRSSDGWSENYNCDMGCHLRIEIQHGETMHAAPNREKWTRKEPRKPREWMLVYKGNGTWKDAFECDVGLSEKPIKLREVIE